MLLNSPSGRLTRSVLIPSKGIGIRAGDKPMSEYRKNRGDMVGHHWRVPAASQGRELRALNIDTNYWKSFIHNRLAVPVGDRGGLSLFGLPTEQRADLGTPISRVCGEDGGPRPGGRRLEGTAREAG